MSLSGQQRLISYHYLPITQVQLHSQQQLKSLISKHSAQILSPDILQCNKKMAQYISHNDKKIDYKKWSKQVDKILIQASKQNKFTEDIKLNQIQKIQLFNTYITNNIKSQPQLILINHKLASLNHKYLQLLLSKFEQHQK